MPPADHTLGVRTCGNRGRRDSPDPGTTGLQFGQLLRLFALLSLRLFALLFRLFALLFRLFALRLLFIAATTSCSKGNQQTDDRPAPRASGP